MDTFLRENNFDYLSTIFKAHGITETNFFTLSQSLINTIVKDSSVIDKFSSAFYLEKLNHELREIDVLSVEEIPLTSNTDNESNNTQLDITLTEAEGGSASTVAFNVHENELTEFLRKSEIGKGIIGIYERTGIVKERQLKDLVIVRELEKNIKMCKITSDRFVKLRDLTVEAFPNQSELALLWYEPYVTQTNNKQQHRKSSDNNTKSKRAPAQGHRGIYYSCYKYWRKFFREGGNSQCDDGNSDADDDCEINHQSESGLLKSDYILDIREKSDPTEIIKCWDQHYSARQSALQQVTSIDVYISSLQCLNSELAPILIQSDFHKLYQQKDPENKFHNIFELQWPAVAKELLQIYKNNRKSRPEIDSFLKNFDERIPIIIDNDLTDQINIIALLGLPIFLSHKPNIYTTGPDDIIKKSNLLDSFILVCEDADDTSICGRIADLEKFHEDHKLPLPLPPLVILCGAIEDVKKCYVLISNYKHTFNNILQAVQFCFKAYKTFSMDFPELCKPAWSFIQRRIYKVQLSRGISCVDDLVRRLNQLTAPQKRKEQLNKDCSKKRKN